MEQRLSMANDLRESEKYGESSKAYTECFVDLIAINDVVGLIHCLGGQGLIYKNLLTKNNSPIYHHLATAFAKEALDVAEVNKDKLDGRTISIAYSTYGDVLIKDEKLQEALPYYEKALSISTAGIQEKGRLKAHIGGIQYQLGDKLTGIATIESALSEIRSGDMDYYAVRVWETGALNGLAMVYAKEGNQEKALEFANESLKIATDHNLPIRKRQIEQILEKISAGQTDFSI